MREGDFYIVNGQKTWTTLAQFADWIFCLVRTNTEVKQQEGITFLLIDMKSPGITVKPIIVLDGAHEVNEVFFDNVKVPVDNRVGEENKGWTYAKFLLVQRTLRHRRRRALEARGRAVQGDRRSGDWSTAAADRRRGVLAQGRRTRDRSISARNHRTAHARARNARARWRARKVRS